MADMIGAIAGLGQLGSSLIGPAQTTYYRTKDQNAQLAKNFKMAVDDFKLLMAHMALEQRKALEEGQDLVYSSTVVDAARKLREYLKVHCLYEVPVRSRYGINAFAMRIVATAAEHYNSEDCFFLTVLDGDVDQLLQETGLVNKMKKLCKRCVDGKCKAKP